MNDEEFEKWYNAVKEKESPLDGSCTNEIVSGLYSRLSMERTGLLYYSGVTGKTRIVIEYDNDTGQGWRRIVTEDPNTVPIPKDLKDSLRNQPENPTQYTAY